MSDPSKSALVVESVEPRVSDPTLSPLESDGPGSVIVQKAPKRTWRSHLWDTWDKPPEERHLLFKLDFALMVIIYAFLTTPGVS